MGAHLPARDDVPFRVPPPFASEQPHCTPQYCINERGYKTSQLWQEFPVLAPFYTKFEAEAFASTSHPWYPCESLHSWVRDKLWLCIPITIFYLIAIFWGQHWMKQREAADLRLGLIVWNWFLAIFSAIGALRVAPHALYRCDDLLRTICAVNQRIAAANVFSNISAQVEHNASTRVHLPARRVRLRHWRCDNLDVIFHSFKGKISLGLRGIALSQAGIITHCV